MNMGEDDDNVLASSIFSNTEKYFSNDVNTSSIQEEKDEKENG